MECVFRWKHFLTALPLEIYLCSFYCNLWRKKCAGQGNIIFAQETVCFCIKYSNILCDQSCKYYCVVLFQSNVAASNAKLALFYDWFFFDTEKDSIMNIGTHTITVFTSYEYIKTHY